MKVDYEQIKKKYPLGSGGRHRALTAILRARGAKNPEALASWIGRKWYGKKVYNRLAAEGRRRAILARLRKKKNETKKKES